MAWGIVVAEVLSLFSWLRGVFKDSLLDWELGRRACMKCAKEVYKTFPRPQALSHPPLLFQRALPGIGWHRNFIFCVNPAAFMVLSLYHRTSHRTLMVVDRDSGGPYPCGISENKTSNIVLTSAECKGDFPLCWLCCYMAKAIIWSCLSGTLLPVILPTERLR